MSKENEITVKMTREEAANIIDLIAITPISMYPRTDSTKHFTSVCEKLDKELASSPQPSSGPERIAKDEHDPCGHAKRVNGCADEGCEHYAPMIGNVGNEGDQFRC